MGFYHISEEPPEIINPINASFYQERPCTYSIFEILSQDLGDFEIYLLNSPNGEVECFGKNSWYEYQPEKLIENGWEKYEKDFIKIWFFTNINIDLFVQSLFWLIFISFIPKVKERKFEKSFLFSVINTLLFYIHLIGEEGFYKASNRNYDIAFVSREYNGDLYFENYFLYLYFISIFMISFLFIKFAESRLHNFLNYLPFTFLIFGTYSSLNLNFYLIIFCLLGFYSIYKKYLNLKITLLYLVFSTFWLINLNNQNINFDVDKLKGFSNSSQTLTSLIFWILVYFLVVSGVIFLIKESREYFSPIVFRRNLLITSTLITIFGLLSASNKIINYFTYYFFGLNKYGMRSLESIEGNTWRGLAPSAEGMGEFYAFVILFFVIYSYEKKLKFSLIDIFFLVVTIIGLSRTNNFAAIASLIFLIFIYFLNKKIKSIKMISLFFFLLTSLSILIYSQFFKEFSYNYLSSNILYEGIQASEIDYIMETNEFGENQAQLGNYQYILEIPKDQANLSTSLRFLIEDYTYGYNINNIPSLNSVFNIASYFINRSEKWGIFFAKYNPNIFEFLLGSGPQQLTDYYFEHITKYNYGLFLPHSTFLTYLVFFGIFGILIILNIVFKIFLKNKNSLYSFFIAFFLLNFIKSDSLLYLPNLLLISFLINFPNLFKMKSTEK